MYVALLLFYVCFSMASLLVVVLQHKATALGFYNWGIYIGYSIAFAFNFILLSVGWRWTFRVAALPGFLVGAVMLFTVKELPHSAKVAFDMQMNILHAVSIFFIAHVIVSSWR